MNIELLVINEVFAPIRETSVPMIEGFVFAEQLKTAIKGCMQCKDIPVADKARLVT
jgi:hypothetical protein